MSGWTIYGIREANSEELEAAFSEPSCEVVRADLARYLYEALREVNPGVEHAKARLALRRYEREVGA